MTTAASQRPASCLSAAYEELINCVRDANLLASTAEILHWDQETMMPAGGVVHRSEQVAQLARLGHQMATDPRVGEALAACEGDAELMQDPESVAAVNVREIRHDYDRRTKLPTDLVEELTRTKSLAEHEWARARDETDFARFRPWFEKLVELLRRKAACYGWPQDGEPWDALAEGYEPGSTAADIERVFHPLRPRLHKLIGELMATTRPSSSLNRIKLPIEQQEKFVRFVSEQMGFDYSRGRLDRSAHPFCGGSHCNDVRLTTRFRDDNILDALGSTVHESGHGMYEQGLLFEHRGTPMGTSVSLGIHESQSRLWENQVARSRPFWTWCFPLLKKFFGSSVDGLTVNDAYSAANIVEPSFIRVEADEVTYHMHVMVRFDIERALMNEELAVADVPGVWNEKYRAYLGLKVPDDRRGCLQDVHWSLASVGYFPTYTLGSLYAAQFFEQVRRDVGDLDDQLACGEFGPLRAWLSERIHQHGMRYRAADLCERVTGEPLSAEPLMRQLEAKLKPLYQL